MANQYSNPAPKIIVKCPCGKKIVTTQKRIDDGRGKYCSRSCKKKYCPPPQRVKGDQKTFNPNSGQFKKGHIAWTVVNKGKYKLKKVKRGYHNSPETEFKKGDKHQQWLGDKVGYAGVHGWIRKEFGQPSICERCGTTTANKYHWHNKLGDYKRERSGWERLCVACHVRHHKMWEKRKWKNKKKK